MHQIKKVFNINNKWGQQLLLGLGSAASMFLSMYNGNSNWKYSLLGTIIF